MSYRGKEKPEDRLPLHNDSDDGKGRFLAPHAAASRRSWASHRQILAYLLALWVVLIHVFERVAIRRALLACQWDDWEQWQKGLVPHRIVLVGDPQIVDAHTYPDRPALFNFLIQRISDNYLYRNHVNMHTVLDPDTTIFLGDLFDGGREWEDDEWFREYQRFNRVFPQPPNRRTISSLPGNHDIGYHEILWARLKRFAAFFGESNDYFELGNHYVIVLDGILLLHPDPVIHQEARHFLETLNDRLNPLLPRILLIHVPLYHFNDQQPCGPLREKKGKFPVMRGVQYQTVLEYDILQQILSTVRPTVIFSGDDHDYCDVTHLYVKNGVHSVAREVTVKTASMTNGVRYPALQLLSLFNPYDPRPKKIVDADGPVETSTYDTKMCYLPSPYLALNSYIFTYLLLVGLLALVHLFPRNYAALRARVWALLQGKPLKGPRDIYEDAKNTKNWPAWTAQSTALTLALYTLFGLYFHYV